MLTRHRASALAFSMAKDRGRTVRVAPGPVGPTYASLQPALDRAQAAVRIAVLTLAAKCVVGLLTAGVTGWVLTINPAAGNAPWQSIGVSDNVMALVLTANRVDMATFALAALAVLVAGLFVIAWQLAAMRNLPALGAGPARWSRPAAAVAWFVPGWNLYAPKQVFDQLWHSSAPGRLTDLPQDPAGSVELPRFLSAWWALWVGANVAYVTVTCATVATGTVTSLLTAQLSTVAVCAALAGAGVHLGQVLSAITRRQAARRAALA